MNFNKTVTDIKRLKIQGAENVAKSAANAITQKYFDLLKQKKENDLIKYINILEETRSTEPCMRNTLHFFYESVKKKPAKKVLNEIETHFKNSDKNIEKYTAEKIRNNSIIYTHCHSGSVVRSIISARNSGKKITVHNTETRPLFQGRITAVDLAKKGIKVVHFVDSGMRLAIKDADIILLGADAVTTEGFVYNKIGSEIVCEQAKVYDVPVYICTNSWKFDPKTIFGFDEKIEQRHKEEVWKNPPRNVEISNYAFEKIKPELITGIITELGVTRPEILSEEVKKAYPWMFK